MCFWLAQACDLLGVAAHERFERKGLCTLATVLVDYRGYRVVCQSVIPGEWVAQWACLYTITQYFCNTLPFCMIDKCECGCG